MKHNADRRDWNPILNGDLFCSPACGGGCTHAAYKEAQIKAKELAAAMGRGWKPNVWENLGWHYAATKSKAEVVRGHDGSLTLYWNVTPQIVVEGMTPAAVLSAARRRVDDFRRELCKLTGELFDDKSES